MTTTTPTRRRWPTAPMTERSLDEYALLLKNAAPEPYDEFVDAVERYVGELYAGIVRCPVEELVNYQGRIQQAQGFLHLIRNCHVRQPSEPAAR